MIKKLSDYRTKKTFEFSRRYIFVSLFAICIVFHIGSYYFFDTKETVIGIIDHSGKRDTISPPPKMLKQTIILGVLEQNSTKIIFKCTLNEEDKKLLATKGLKLEAKLNKELQVGSFTYNGKDNSIIFRDTSKFVFKEGKVEDKIVISAGNFSYIAENQYEFIVEQESKGVISSILEWTLGDILKSIGGIFALIATIYYTSKIPIINIFFERRKEKKSFNKHLEKYKSDIALKNSTFGLLFCKSKKFSMDDAFIELTAKGKLESDNDSKDLFEIIKVYKRLIITGAPGAGKSLFCKKVLQLCCKENNFGFRNTIPILIELGSYKEGSPIKNYIPPEFSDCGHLLEEQLEKGEFLFLLDGFDEISEKNQSATIKNEILKFINDYRNCRYIITCRDEVYKSDFCREIDTEYVINEFDKDQIKTYIKTWLKLPNTVNKKGFTSNEIYNVLQENSHLMELARTPLMLAMILYLHVDKDKTLPHSRGEFYELLTKVLLDSKEMEIPKSIEYKWEYKELKSLLSHIAWNMNDRVMSKSKIKELIRNTKQEESDVNSVINNVLLHSNLIQRIKGEEMDEESIYRFSHKTIQEYFIAYYVLHNIAEDLLLGKFENNPPYWKKTIRLYCNLYKGDISNFLEKINKIKPDIALECLAEIKTNVSNENDILNGFISMDFKSKWKNNDGKNYIIKALGLIISGYRDEGVIQQRSSN